MNIVAIVQARMSSERLPGKVLKEINDLPSIRHIYNRISLSKKISKAVIATSVDVTDDKLYNFCKSESINIFRGNLNNVLERYYKCAVREQADIIVRLTGDNVLVDSYIIDKAIDIFLESQELDYLHYCKEVPLGMAVEVFSFSALERTYLQAIDVECKEHVTLYMYKNNDKFECAFYSDSKLCNNSDLRWTMDTEEDYKLICSIYQWFGNKEFHYQDILEAYEKNPQWSVINSAITQKKINYNGE